MSVEHYENFPVASILCPPDIRPAVVAIYHFARTADDLADEGDADLTLRQSDLQAYRDDLDAIFAGRSPSRRWERVFMTLDAARRRHALPHAPLADLLDAFMQDTANPVYADRKGLLDYCRRSANPVGRLLLHLYGIEDANSLAQSDAICSALQLINFWQDCSVDLPRGRVYLPLADARRHGVELDQPAQMDDGPATRALLRDLCQWSHALMLEGACLATRVPGRAGWELRLVVQGGLRILEKIQRMGYCTIRHRPILTLADGPVMLWRAWGMGAGARGDRR